VPRSDAEKNTSKPVIKPTLTFPPALLVSLQTCHKLEGLLTEGTLPRKMKFRASQIHKPN
jgi:hypothetical protein